MSILLKLNIQDVLNLMPDPVIVVDNLGNIEFSNPSFAKMLGYTVDELYNQNIINYLVDDSVFGECMVELHNHGTCDSQATIFLTKKKQHIATTKNVALLNIEGKEYALVSLRDISQFDQINQKFKNSKIELEQRSKQLVDLMDKHKQELTQQQIQLDEIVNTVDEIIWYIDDKTMEIKYVSNAIENIFLRKKDDFLNGSSLWIDMVYNEDKQKVLDFFSNRQADNTVIIDFRIQRQDGSTRWLSSTITHHPSLNFFIGITRDITQQRQYQEQIKFMAYHDSLTNLPNRSYLSDIIDSLLNKSKIIQQNFAILFLDLDNFKYINDSMGHDVGDEVLIKISDKLVNILENKGTCIRFGGDEFIIIVNNIQNEKDIKIIAKSILDEINKPFLIKEREFYISSSIGISLYPKDAQTSTELIKAGDTAMYRAKLSGKNRYTFYDKSMDTSINEFFKIENIIKDALVNSYFSLYFQPIICANSLTLCGFEALLRLKHPDYGFISPEIFIPIAESSGDIIKISDFVVSEACKFARSVNLLSDKDMTISINISARQFKEQYFARNFLKCMQLDNISAKFIKIEIVESAIMENIELAIQELKLLQKAGIKISLDDFGTGYSSFAYLATLPIDTIKIDKSFVIDMLENKDNKHIVKSIISLAHHLNKDVVAEGVETLQHVEALKANNVDMLQGFYFSKAIHSKKILDNFHYYKQMFNLN